MTTKWIIALIPAFCLTSSLFAAELADMGMPPSPEKKASTEVEDSRKSNGMGALPADAFENEGPLGEPTTADPMPAAVPPETTTEEDQQLKEYLESLQAKGPTLLPPPTPLEETKPEEAVEDDELGLPTPPADFKPYTLTSLKFGATFTNAEGLTGKVVSAHLQWNDEAKTFELNHLVEFPDGSIMTVDQNGNDIGGDIPTLYATTPTSLGQPGSFQDGKPTIVIGVKVTITVELDEFGKRMFMFDYDYETRVALEGEIDPAAIPYDV